MKKKKEEFYKITLKGILCLVLDDSILIDSVLDRVELYMRRNEYNAIVLHDGIFSFEKVEMVKKDTK